MRLVNGFVLVATIAGLVAAGCGAAAHDPVDGAVDPTPDGGSPGGADAGPDAGAIAQTYVVTELSSSGTPAAAHTDATLLDPWGLASGTSGPLWVADKTSGSVRSYAPDGTVASTVAMPASSGTTEEPVGMVYNGERSFDGDEVITATDSGQIVGWTPGAAPVVRVDNSVNRAVYKSLALARTSTGDRLYAANFRDALVEMYGGDYSAGGTFTDPGIPAGFGPFNIAVINQQLYVTYAKQDDNDHDQVNGAGLGYVDIFDLTGQLVQELIAGSPLNAPYGVVLTPVDFGRFADILLVGNAGDGRVNTFDPVRGAFLGPLPGPGYTPIAIDGLHDLLFGNDQGGGSHDTLFFTAGPNGGTAGLFGDITGAL